MYCYDSCVLSHPWELSLFTSFSRFSLFGSHCPLFFLTIKTFRQFLWLSSQFFPLQQVVYCYDSRVLSHPWELSLFTSFSRCVFTPCFSLSTIILGFSGYKYIRDVDKVTCEEICLDDADCVAVEFRNFTSTICSFFKGDVDGKVVNRKGSQIIVFLSQLATNKKVLSLEKASFRGYAYKATRHDSRRCRRQCLDELECDAYTWSSSRSLKCSLFLAKDIKNIRYDFSFQAVFVQDK